MFPVEERKPFGLAVYDIIREAQAGAIGERRDTVRYSFFRPVIIQSGKARHAGFSREVSETGIGLLHSTKLPPGDVEVSIPTEKGYSIRIRTRIVWCIASGEGWYISGGEFLGISGIDA